MNLGEFVESLPDDAECLEPPDTMDLAEPDRPDLADLAEADLTDFSRIEDVEFDLILPLGFRGSGILLRLPLSFLILISARS
mmetsp:Transcript_20718/g.23468  ORF Transcript_20718/g.23468 Transcript_20718/m.23468 type:complete len:82 (+) Transcript_20718:1049-1294(+)